MNGKRKNKMKTKYEEELPLSFELSKDDVKMYSQVLGKAPEFNPTRELERLELEAQTFIDLDTAHSTLKEVYYVWKNGASQTPSMKKGFYIDVLLLYDEVFQGLVK